MGLKEQTHSWQRHAFGSPWDKNICKFSFGYTHTFKKAAAGTATSVLAATTCGTTTTTIVNGITDPDVPRVLKITTATAAGIGDGSAIITGTNVEGATITETFDIVDGVAGATNGTKAFKTVSSVVVSPMKGTCTVSVGTLDILGMNHRLFPSNTTIKEVIDNGTTRSLVATNPTITDADEQHIEKNLVTPVTTVDGTYFFTFYYDYDAWSVNDLNDNPIYHTSTSTSSTSTSTSTTATPTTSTSSTSVSTSSTSVSTSSTSSSTSSTSTSTTTVP
jgi:hypothetical protein